MSVLKLKDITIHNENKIPLTCIIHRAKYIQKVGLQKPLSVTKDYVLVTGLRNLLALKYLGWVDVPCTILSLTYKELIERKEHV